MEDIIYRVELSISKFYEFDTVYKYQRLSLADNIVHFLITVNGTLLNLLTKAIVNNNKKEERNILSEYMISNQLYLDIINNHSEFTEYCYDNYFDIAERLKKYDIRRERIQYL